MSISVLLAMLLVPCPQAPPLLELRGSTPGGRFGAAISSAGDVNGDGRPDVLVGEPHGRVRGTRRGRATVFSGANGAPLLLLEGRADHDRFGAALDGGEDLDADGVPDLVVGAPRGSGGRGSVTAFSGATGRPLFHLEGEAAGDEFGRALALVGDADGDGSCDLLIGAPHNSAAGSLAGRAYLFSGRDRRLLLSIDGAPWDQLGASVSPAGDVDLDGRADLWIGAPFSDEPGFNAGLARAHSGDGGAVLLRLAGLQPGDQLGFSVRRGGDLDGDGRRDLIAAAPASDAGGLDSGALLWCSTSAGPSATPVPGWSSGSYASAVSGVDDLDGDGRDDLVLGAASASGPASESGSIRSFSSSTSQPLAVLSGLSSGDWFGATLTTVGDLDGDSHSDLAIGAPGHDDDPTKIGYVRVYPWTALRP
jgi:hypothetical protein